MYQSNTKNSNIVIVIGAGVAGLAASIRLAKAGYQVHVYEAAHTYGGKVKEYRWQGFRFDTGPSLFTLPELVEELYVLCGKNPKEAFRYYTLASVTRYFYSDGLVVDSFSNAEKFAMEAHEKLNANAVMILKFLKKQAKTYRLLAPVFLENSIHKIFTLFKWKNLPALWHAMNPQFLKPMAKVNSRFFNNDYLTKIFNRYGTYNGSNPYQMPSLFNIISHLEHNVGAYLPEKGMRQIPDALYQLALELGVNFHFNCYVEKIEVEGKEVKGVWVSGEFVGTDAVVSNMDVNFTYEKLLAHTQKHPKIFLENQKSTSALIFHWAVEGEHTLLDTHNILFADNYREEFDHLFLHKNWYRDPTIYIYVSSKTVKHDAPQGKENWFVMINMPHLTDDGAVTRAEIDALKDVIIKKVGKVTGIEVENKILHEHVITPIDLQATTHSYLGSLYGASSNSIFSAFLRHPNFSPYYKGLYFCGGTVHPGGGVPLCLLSAKITADLMVNSH